MSIISDIHTLLRDRVAAILPDKRELSDSIDIQNNDDLSLKDGYAIHIGRSVNTFRLVGCKYSIQTEVDIVLTKIIMAGHKSIEKIVEIEDTLLEERHSLIADFSENEDIGTLVTKRDWISDSGIVRIFNDKKSFIMIEMVFQFEYLEDF